MLKTLLKIRLASFYAGFTGMQSRKKKPSAGRGVLFALLMVYCAGAFGFMFFGFFSSLAEPFYGAGLAWLYFSFLGLTAFALMFVGSVFTTKAQLFEAKDNELLLSMPIRPGDILGSRMAALLLMNLVFELLCAVPAAIAWLQAAPLSAAGWFSLVVIVLVLPLLAQAFSCLVAWLVSLMTARVRNKSLMTTLFSLAFLGAYFYFFSQVNTYITQLVASGSAIAGRLGAVAPVYWLGDSVANGNLVSLALLAAVCLGVFALLCWLLARSFLRIVTTKRGFARIKYEEKTLRVSSRRSALLGREFARLGSSPGYMLNSGLGLVFIVGGAAAMLIKRAELLTALAQLGYAGDRAAALLALALCMTAGLVLFTAPSVSLEGKSLWIARSMPVPTREVLRAKQNMNLWLTLPCVLFCSLAGLFVFRPGPAAAAGLVLLPAAFTVLSGNIGLIANLRHPNLSWINETQAVKQGMSVLLSMLVNWGLALAAGLPYLLLLENRMDGGLYLLLCTAVTALAALLTERWLGRRGVLLFESL